MDRSACWLVAVALAPTEQSGVCTATSYPTNLQLAQAVDSTWQACLSLQSLDSVGASRWARVLARSGVPAQVAPAAAAASDEALQRAVHILGRARLRGARGRRRLPLLLRLQAGRQACIRAPVLSVSWGQRLSIAQLQATQRQVQTTGCRFWTFACSSHDFDCLQSLCMK